MKKTLRILLFTTVFSGMLLTSFADRGVGKKRAKVDFNIKMPTSFTSSLKFNLRNGLKYNGTFFNNKSTSNVNKTVLQNAYVTYKKGNSVYILPYKQKLFVPDVKQGFTGTKLIIRLR
jgi:hypothetical protein